MSFIKATECHDFDADNVITIGVTTVRKPNQVHKLPSRLSKTEKLIPGIMVMQLELPVFAMMIRQLE